MTMKSFYLSISLNVTCTFLTLTCNVNIISVGKYFISNTLIFIVPASCIYHQNMLMHIQGDNFDLYKPLQVFLFEMLVPSFIALIWKFFPLDFILKEQNLIVYWVFLKWLFSCLKMVIIKLNFNVCALFLLSQQ